VERAWGYREYGPRRRDRHDRSRRGSGGDGGGRRRAPRGSGARPRSGAPCPAGSRAVHVARRARAMGGGLCGGGRGRLGRLLQMGLAEVSCRSRQGLLKRLERVAPVARSREVRGGDAAPEIAVARFFEGPRHPLTPGLVRTLPGAVVAPVITAAEAACVGRF